MECVDLDYRRLLGIRRKHCRKNSGVMRAPEECFFIGVPDGPWLWLVVETQFSREHPPQVEVLLRQGEPDRRRGEIILTGEIGTLPQDISVETGRMPVARKRKAAKLARTLPNATSILVISNHRPSAIPELPYECAVTAVVSIVHMPGGGSEYVGTRLKVFEAAQRSYGLCWETLLAAINR